MISPVYSHEPRRPGRPKGIPRAPGSGRKKGTPNRLTAEMKAIIIEKGRPLDLLCAIAAGKLVKVGGTEPGTSIKVIPSLSERLAAAQILISKVAPTDADARRVLDAVIAALRAAGVGGR